MLTTRRQVYARGAHDRRIFSGTVGSQRKHLLRLKPSKIYKRAKICQLDLNSNIYQPKDPICDFLFVKIDHVIYSSRAWADLIIRMCESEVNLFLSPF